MMFPYGTFLHIISFNVLSASNDAQATPSEEV